MGRIRVLELLQDKVLAGKPAAWEHRPRLEEAVRDLRPGNVVALDFGGIEFMTASFFQASFWPVFWDSVEAENRDLYPLILGANEELRFEIVTFLKSIRKPILMAAGENSRPSITALNLAEPSSVETFDLVKELGPATAADLHKSKKSVSQTGWNNRLALLNKQRMVYREKRGREFWFSLVPYNTREANGYRFPPKEECGLY